MDKRSLIITGGCSGLGLAIAECFSRMGCKVVIADINVAQGPNIVRSINQNGGEAAFLQVNVEKESDIRDMVLEAVKINNGIDIIIHSARPRLRCCPFPENMAEWELTMNVLLKAPALMVQYALPYLRNSECSSVLNIASLNALSISHQPVGYHVAKAGLAHLTRYLACELGHQKIRVNTLCPALVNIQRGENSAVNIAKSKEVTSLAVPLGRAATVEEIAEAAYFLCSPKASYITGQMLVVDGGMSLWDHYHLVWQAYSK